MEILTSTYTYEELTGATRLLENMRDNCVKNDTDAYDDPDRERKYEALNIAIDAIKKLPVKKKAMLSQPMAGKTDEEIVTTREKAVTALEAKGYEIVNTLFTDSLLYHSFYRRVVQQRVNEETRCCTDSTLFLGKVSGEHEPVPCCIFL